MADDNNDSYEVARDSVLYIIDASAAMEKAAALTIALSSASWAIRDAAREGVTRNDAGVIVYNVAKSDSGGKSKASAHVLLSLEEPKVEEIKRMIRLSNNIENFRSEFTPLEPSGDSLISALRLANSKMNQLHTRSMRRVVLITNNDDPMLGADSSKVMVVANLVSDLTGSPAFLMPIFLKTRKEGSDIEDFDIRKFWINLNYMPPPIASAATNNFSSMGADDLFSNTKLLEPWDLSTLANPRRALILSKSRRKYISFKGEISIGKLSIGVRGYNVVHFYHKASPLKIAHVTTKSGQKFRELLMNERMLAFSDSGRKVNEDDESIKSSETKKFKLGSAMKNEADWTVPVKDQQLKELHTTTAPGDRSPGHPVIYIHKFVDSSSASIPGHIGHSVFITPSSDLFTQSWTAFAALQRTMRRKGVVALVTLHPTSSPNRSNTPETGLLFASNPDQQSGSEKGNPVKPNGDPVPNTDSGMYLVPFPYTNDLRSHPTRKEPPIKNEKSSRDSEDHQKLKEDVATLCAKFTLWSGFNPARFPHPLVAQFAEILEHHALSLPLEKDAMEKKDETRPRYEKIAKTSSLVSYHIKRRLHSLAPSPSDPMKSPDSGLEPASPKRIKGEVPSDQEITDAYASQVLDKFTVSQLKQAISQHETPISRLKGPLVDQLRNLVKTGRFK